MPAAGQDLAPGDIVWQQEFDGPAGAAPDASVWGYDLGGGQWVFDKPYFLILTVAVGGQWPGYPDGSTVLPQEMKVDYVRVYANS